MPSRRQAPHSTPMNPQALLLLAQNAEDAQLRLLQQLVEIESPGTDRAAVNRCVQVVAAAGVRLGGKPKRHSNSQFGDTLELRFASRKRGRPLLLLGHIDTVWPLGTLGRMPFRIALEPGGERIAGPGIYDMKAGVTMALTAIEILQKSDQLSRPVTLLLVSDEEVGSLFSRPITEKLARESAAVFVLEPAQGRTGAYKTARKGVGDYTLHVRGVAAHSGVDFTSGHSAIEELAWQIEQIRGFTELERGLTLNVGVIRGGSARNVVAAHAEADIDVRIARAGDAARIDKKLKKLRPRDPRCVLSIEGGVNRPPMERSRATVALFRQAQTLARQMGFALEEASTGGGSDGNFTAALGVPTLDGMGAVGEGAHATHESIFRNDLAPRTALLAAMIANVER